MALEFNTQAPKMQGAADLYSKLNELAGDGTKAKEVTGKALEIIAGSNIKVTRGDDTSPTGVSDKKTNGATSVPSLDNPDAELAREIDLTKLISYLQLDNQERQTEMAKERIEVQKETLDAEQKDRMHQIDESIKKMEKAEKAAKVSRIFGWIGAVLAVVAAAVLTVVTGGLAAGFAIAGAAIAVTSLTLSETGAMDKIIEKLADHLQEKYGMSRNDAMLAASLIVNLSIMALQVGCSVGSMAAGIIGAGKAAADAGKVAADGVALGVKAAGETAKASAVTTQLARNVQNVLTIANTAVAASSLASTGFSTYLNFKSENSKADTTELQKLMTMLQQRLEESQEELQQIMEQIEAGIGKVADLISSATDTSTEIAQNIGQMA